MNAQPKSFVQLRFSRNDDEYELWVHAMALDWARRNGTPLWVELERVREWDKRGEQP